MEASARKRLDMRGRKYPLEKAVRSLIEHVEREQRFDPLVVGFDEFQKKNPLKRERPNKCSLM